MILIKITEIEMISVQSFERLINMSSGVRRVVVESRLGTGSNITLYPGFLPRVVEILNVGGNCTAKWCEGMAAASMQKIVDSGSGATDISLVTSGGVTASTASVIIGTDSDLNASGEQLHIICYE